MWRQLKALLAARRERRHRARRAALNAYLLVVGGSLTLPRKR